MKKFVTLILAMFMLSVLFASANPTVTNHQNYQKFKPKIENCTNVAVVHQVQVVNFEMISVAHQFNSVQTPHSIKTNLISFNFSDANINEHLLKVCKGKGTNYRNYLDRIYYKNKTNTKQPDFINLS